MVVKDVTVHTDEKTIWVNSADGCEIRICGLKNLKGLKEVKAVLHDEGTNKDVTIL